MNIFQNKSTKYFIITLFLLFFMGCAGTQKTTDYKLNINDKNKNKTENSYKLDKDLKPDYLKLSKELIKQGFYNVALSQLEKIEKTGKNETEIYFLTGKCNSENKEYLKAEKKFQQAININSKYAPAYNGLGIVYDMTGKTKKAKQLYKKAIKLNPARSDFYNNLGFSEIIAQKYKEAKLNLLKSISLNPDFMKAKNNLVWVYIMTGEDKKAFSILKNNFPLNIACYNMGVLYIKKGDKKKAEEMYKKSIELKP